MSFYLNYVLGIPSKAGKAASLGNVTHKAMELLAWQSFHRMYGNKEFEEESFGLLQTESITPEWSTNRAYEHYRLVDGHIKWTPNEDLPKLHEWTKKALEWSNGYFDPRNQIIIQPEQRFDITIDKPWAHYHYETPQGVFDGQLQIKGTMDLVSQDKHHTDEIEVTDYKTGRRKDWGIADETLSIKDWKKLSKDPQLLLYFWATRNLYPNASCVHFSILFINDGGPFTFSFTDHDFHAAEDMIREKFEMIVKTRKPEARVGPPCWTFCAYGKRSKAEQDPSKTICNYYRDRLKTETADQIFYEIGDMKKIFAYSDGGGRRAKDE